ncbi:unnamed protein product [Ostreobium quekettii]|uniref:Uncharacterized protein n=1 Tax=Ostreobium quekettii TaxID=121088 RepID=A0A8S1JBS2_9CHLO|nr:unnamed protein product [Ostreobium quekettii]|eukprot:evm.model.scf_89.23 EVM.evm.TU.scf_89.23   scf_89:127607-135207(-)
MTGDSDGDGGAMGPPGADERRIEDPDKVAKFREAIGKNCALQERLSALIEAVDRALEANGKTGALVSGLRTMKRPRGGQTGGHDLVQAEHLDYCQRQLASHWGQGSLKPNPTKEAAAVLPLLQRMPTKFRHSTLWTKDEQQRLAHGLLARLEERLSSDVLAALREGRNASLFTPANLRSVMDEIRTVQLDNPLALRTVAAFSEADWESVAKRGVHTRCAFECKQYWNCFGRPDRRRGPVLSSEAKIIQQLALKYNERNWVQIAEELGTGRHPAECLGFYRRHMQNSGSLRWTTEADSKLVESVQKHGTHNWQTIAEAVGCDVNSCKYRWEYVLSRKGRKRGKWTKHEDLQLLKGIKKFGKVWVKVMTFVPTRTEIQCNERWYNQLDPSIDRSAWSNEECQNLRALVHECRDRYGKLKWSIIAAHFPGRTDSMVSRKWAKLEKATGTRGLGRKRKRSPCDSPVPGQAQTRPASNEEGGSGQPPVPETDGAENRVECGRGVPRLLEPPGNVGVQLQRRDRMCEEREAEYIGALIAFLEEEVMLGRGEDPGGKKGGGYGDMVPGEVLHVPDEGTMRLVEGLSGELAERSFVSM